MGAKKNVHLYENKEDKTRKLYCPFCKKFVVKISADTNRGTIIPYCKNCKKEVIISL